MEGRCLSILFLRFKEGDGKWVSLLWNFQFSFWDSKFHPERLDQPLRVKLSILFLRFLIRFFMPAFSSISLSILFLRFAMHLDEMDLAPPRPLSILFLRFKPFVKAFVKFLNVALSILFLRFSKGVIDDRLSEHENFQFSFWDSEKIQRPRGRGPLHNRFQFSFWDSGYAMHAGML